MNGQTAPIKENTNLSQYWSNSRVAARDNCEWNAASNQAVIRDDAKTKIYNKVFIPAGLPQDNNVIQPSDGAAQASNMDQIYKKFIQNWDPPNYINTSDELALWEMGQGNDGAVFWGDGDNRQYISFNGLSAADISGQWILDENTANERIAPINYSTLVSTDFDLL